MGNWKPGDKAKCVKIGGPLHNVVYPNLILNKVYTVQKVYTCECGVINLDVGLGLSDMRMGVECPCGALSSPRTNIHWCDSLRFVKEITDKAELSEALEEALVNEDYESASVLRDKINN